MGFLAKRATAAKIATVIVPWRRNPTIPASLPDDLALYLTALPLLVQATRSFLSTPRIRLLDNSFALEVGSAGDDGDGTYSFEWRLRMSLTVQNQVEIAVTHYITKDDALQNEDEIDDCRRWLANALAVGADVECTAAPIDYSDWLQATYLRRPGRFSLWSGVHHGDHCPKLPQGFVDGMHIAMPMNDAAALTQAFRESGGHVPADGQVLAQIETCYWSPEHSSRLILRQAGDQLLIEVSSPRLRELSLIGGHRVARGVFCALADVSNRIRSSAPGSSALLNGVLDAYRSSATSPERHHWLTSLWSDAVPGYAVPLRGGWLMPVGILATTSNPHVSELLEVAQRSLLVRHRFWQSRPARADSEAEYGYAVRRPVFLQTDEGRPALRYVAEDGSHADPLLAEHVERHAMLFWEAQPRELMPDSSGRHRVLLMATAHMVTGHALTYGTELLTLFRTWQGLVRSADPSAEVTTICVRLPVEGGETGGQSDLASRIVLTSDLVPMALDPPPLVSAPLPSAPAASAHVACSACGGRVSAKAKFCTSCAAPMLPPVVRCSNCGAENVRQAKFCVACGTPLPVSPPATTSESRDERVVST